MLLEMNQLVYTIGKRAKMSREEATISYPRLYHAHMGNLAKLSATEPKLGKL